MLPKTYFAVLSPGGPGPEKKNEIARKKIRIKLKDFKRGRHHHVFKKDNLNIKTSRRRQRGLRRPR